MPDAATTEIVKCLTPRVARGLHPCPSPAAFDTLWLPLQPSALTSDSVNSGVSSVTSPSYTSLFSLMRRPEA